MSDIRRIRSLTHNSEEGNHSGSSSGGGYSGSGYRSFQSGTNGYGFGASSGGAAFGGHVIAPPISFNDIHQIPIISV